MVVEYVIDFLYRLLGAIEVLLEGQLEGHCAARQPQQIWRLQPPGSHIGQKRPF